MNFIWAFLIGFASSIILTIFVAVYKLNKEKAKVNQTFGDMAKKIQESQKQNPHQSPQNTDEEKENSESDNK